MALGEGENCLSKSKTKMQGKWSYLRNDVDNNDK